MLDALQGQLARLGNLWARVVLVLQQQLEALGRPYGAQRLPGLMPHPAQDAR